MALSLEELVMRHENFKGRYVLFFYKTVCFAGRIKDFNVRGFGITKIQLVIELEWLAGRAPGLEDWEFVAENVDFVVENSPSLTISNIGIKGGVSIKVKPKDGMIKIMPKNHKINSEMIKPPGKVVSRRKFGFRPINLRDSL